MYECAHIFLMAPVLDQIKPSTEQIEKPTLVEAFDMYVDQEFGHDLWDNLLEEPHFKKLIEYYYPSAGDLIFSEIVDTVADATGGSIRFLLEDFSVYYQSFTSF